METVDKKTERKERRRNVRDTKKNLRVMKRNGEGHRARTSLRVVKYGTKSFARNIWLSLAATLVMTITLIIILATIVASVILSSTADSIREKIDITIFFKSDASAEALDQMAATMRKDENVREIKTATAEQEYLYFLEENKDQQALLESLGDEALRNLVIAEMPATMEVKVYNIDDLSSIEQIVQADNLFQQYINPENPPTYDLNRSEIETINAWANSAKMIGWVLSGIFLIISVLVIFNTIRMAIFSRREEIYMMQLVGADNFFIRGPFLVEAQMSGLISGLLASTAAYFGCRFLTPHLEDYGINMSQVTDVMNSEKLVYVFVITCLVGIVIGSLSARLAIHKYLRRKAAKR